MTYDCPVSSTANRRVSVELGWSRSDRFRLLLLPIAVAFTLVSPLPAICAYEWNHAGSRPVINRSAIAGVWSLRPKPAYPMKEFTVYPKTPPDNDDDALLLLLKEDGSFQQCNDASAAAKDIDYSWSNFRKQKSIQNQLQHMLLHGTWDYRDGKLILAADRLEPTVSDDLRRQLRPTGGVSTVEPERKQDTLLVGRVVANYETRLLENPALPEEELTGARDVTAAPSANLRAPRVQRKVKQVALDTHLSVPKGSVKVGRFFYPRTHPSFFEQPMFQPKLQGSFSLRQVLGSLNTSFERDEDKEKFQRSDFYNKTFSLVSNPIGYKPKSKLRWSTRQNKMIHDPLNKAAAEAAKAQDSRPTNIRVMLVQFHANNTFSTVAGLGEAILRGKFDIIGQFKDQLWMQVWRFGFGRSVSGSVYSEGRMLSHEDAKTYWGEIRYEKRQDEEREDVSNAGDSGATNRQQQLAPEKSDLSSVDANQGEPPDNKEELSMRLEVNGSVMIGWGIEPTPEARFIMREAASDDARDEEEDDDEDDDIVVGDASIPYPDTDGIYWANEDKDSFQ
jgi:hypothetical protein